MASNPGPDAPVAGLAKAKAYYDEKQYPKASATFKQIANSCTCGMQVRATPCCCKSLVPAITNGALDAELRKKCICSAKSDVRCKSPNHLDALDGLAAVYEARRLVDKAIAIAEAMINLAPREPKGFLRLGRLLRLQRSFQPAFQTYRQGIELVSKKNPSHPLLPTLHQMRDKVKCLAVATDPLTVLPLELVVMILKNIDFRTLCRCLRVSKSWKSLLTTKDVTIQSLWRIQHFDRCTKPVRPGLLQKYAAYSGAQVTELVIGNCHQFRVDLNILRWIATCRSLRVLNLRAPSIVASPAIDRSSIGPLCVPQLTSLYLGFYTAFQPDFVHKIIASSAATLQELTILNLPNRLLGGVVHVEDEYWPVLQNLRVLRLGIYTKSNVGLAVVCLPRCMRNCPNVEELWLDGVGVVIGDNPSELINVWRNVKKLFVGSHFEWVSTIPLIISLSPEIEELHLMNYRVTAQFLLTAFDEFVTDHKPQNLRKLTLRPWVPTIVNSGWPEYLEKWVRPSLESGSLTELGMIFPKSHPDWFRSEHLKFLNVKGLSTVCGTDPYKIDEALADLLDRFPNLEGLDVSQEPLSNTALAKAVRRGVKLIYHRGDYNLRTEVREWALQKHNARIVEGDYITNLPMYPRDENHGTFY
ncbi:hypothetical protein F5B22DRAFT_583859 [Xylaria bambusicola]|uniref:uncharacterized protein n=1 Tax=Xylaria bambusicola TaxID=326684 RepID=UPI0020085A4A|nr:uncharacterized protein F5B22DRAFT_583859 [Xylaria bambusicola]KAI0528153.1 hypothetical protein F5B22DRAFT_583859 [Xylaria bambusicola]